MLFFFQLWASYSNAASLAAGPMSSSNLAAPALLTPSSSNYSSENMLGISCDSRKFGKNLKVNSCRNIFNYLIKDETQYDFADRDSGRPNSVPLPLRTYSSENPHECIYCLDTVFLYLTYKYHRSQSDSATIDDGLCFIQPFLKPGAGIGHASATQIGQAAYTTLQTCVIERGMGGVATNIGECPKLTQS